jgi:protein farnesyltransferase subunit beta
LILDMADQCDLDAQERWLLQRQVKLEGGFQGRTNKLVDSCYSFWQGAAAAIVLMARRGVGDVGDVEAGAGGEGGGRGASSSATATAAAATGAAAGAGAAAPAGGAEHDIANITLTAADNDDDDDDDVIDADAEAVRIVPVTDLSGSLSFNQKALQRYILHCAQQTEGGGLRGKR